MTTMKRRNHLSVFTAVLFASLLWNQTSWAHPMMPVSFWQNLRNCAAVYVIPSEFNLTNNSAQNYEFNVYLIGGGGGGGVSSAGSRGQFTQGSFVLAPSQNLYAVVGGGGSGSTYMTGGAGGAGYYGGGGGAVESVNSYGGGGGGGSSALLRNGVVLFHANGGKGGASTSFITAGGDGGTNVGGGAGGFVTGGLTGFTGAYKLGGDGYCNLNNGVELVHGGRGAYGGKSTYDGGSFGQRGLTNGSLPTGCSGRGSGGFGSSGGSSATAYIGNATVDWANSYAASSLQGAGGSASTNGISGSAGVVVLCKKKNADLFVGFPETITSSLSSVVTSVTQTVYGTTGTTLPISVSGTGSPEISINGGAWVTSGNISYGQTLALRQTSAVSASTTATAMVNLGSNSFTWSLTTAQPLALVFTDILNQAANALVTSAAATVTGTGSVAVNVVGTGSPEFSVNGGPWVTSGTLNGGDSVIVRLTTPSIASRKSYAIFRCESCLSTTLTRWSVTTGSLIFPSFGSATGLALSTQQTSPSGVITGTIPGGPYPFTLTGTGSEASVNGGAWVTSGNVMVGDTVQIRVISSNIQNSQLSPAIVSLGAYGYFYITTASTTYPAFSNLVNQGKNLVVSSEVRSVTSGLVNAPISISAASGSPQISINGGAWATSGVLNQGDTLQARMTTSSSNMTSTTVNIVIAGSTTTWLVTTGNGIQLIIPNVNNATPSTTVTTGSIVNTGAAGTLAVNSTAAIADFSLDGGSTWVTSATVAAGQSVVFRASYGLAGTKTVVNVLLDGAEVNPWEINDGSVYSPAISAGSAVLLGAGGMTQLVSVGQDDAFQTLTLPFYFSIAQYQTKTWYICSNTFINVLTSSTSYSGFAGNFPAVPKFFLGAADNSWQRVWSQSGTNYFRIRYEGTASTSGTVGSPNIVYEFTFFKAMGNKQYIQVVFGPHSRSTGAFGVASSSAYFVNGGTITPNSSYVFESDLKGENWVMTPNSKIIGAGTDQ